MTKPLLRWPVLRDSAAGNSYIPPSFFGEKPTGKHTLLATVWRLTGAHHDGQKSDARRIGMYMRYLKTRLDGKDHFSFVEQVCLFGCNEGFIPWLLLKQMAPSQDEAYLWHVSVATALKGTEYSGSVLVIDLKPKQRKSNLSLYELEDVWGYSDGGWTPILARLSGLFIDADPATVNRDEFSIADGERVEPIYEFLYLAGSVADGKLTGGWTAPPASPTNAALLFPDALRYFSRCMGDEAARWHL